MTPRLYLAAGLLSAALVAAGVIWWQGQRIDALKGQNAALRLSVDACNARIKNITEDNRSDDEIDRIPDSDLPAVPDRWLLNPGDGGLY